MANYDAPYLHGYEAALKHHNEVKPVRGREDCRPVGKRRNIHATIRKMEDGTVACRLYNTDVVCYHVDGTVTVVLDGWESPSTCRFINELMGVEIGIRHRRVWVRATHNNVAGWYALNAHDKNIMRRAGGGVGLQFDNPAPVLLHHVNRARANNVRQRYAPFRNYVRRMMKVREGFTMDEFGELFGWVKGRESGEERIAALPPAVDWRAHLLWRSGDANELLALAESSDIADHLKAHVWLARCAGEVGYSRVEAFYIKATAERLLNHFDKLMLRVHRDVCFDEVLAAQGTIARDAYATFFGD